MKKIFFFTLVLFVIVGYYSCVKDRNSLNTDFGILKPFLELRASDFPSQQPVPQPNFAGIDHFDNADIDLLTANTNTVVFYVNLASVNTFSTPINVTVGVDEKLIKTFNDTSQLKYEVLPDFAYDQLDKDVIIPANERVAQIRVEFKVKQFSRLDPTVNYMLPITILKNDGIEVSANEGTVWFHKIGNCIAGVYDAEGTDLLPIYFTPKEMTAVNSTKAEIDYGNQGGAGWKYVITFDCSSNTIVSVAPNDAMYSSIRVNSFTLVEPPTYNSVKKQFHFVTSYLTGSGSLKMTDETLTKE